MMEQLSFDLYHAEKKKYGLDAAGTISWLRSVQGCCHPLSAETVKALFTKFPCTEAFERCKCVTLVDGIHAVDGWTWWDLTDVIGIFNEKDYHTCWDRCWAARQGWTREKVARLDVFAYGRGEHTWKED